MKLTFNTEGLYLAVSDKLMTMLDLQANLSGTDTNDTTDIIFNFRDADYSADLGGYHPVEIRLVKIGDQWRFDYITDFSYQGYGEMAELGKDIDFDISGNSVFQLYCGITPLIDAGDLYAVWQSNFISYVEMQIFTVTVTTD
jgi:hypothetical protein